MIVSIIYLLLIFVLLVSFNLTNKICLFIGLLPFHEFLKKCIETFTGTAGVYPLWRELSIILILISTYKGYRKKTPNMALLSLIVIYVLLMFYIGYDVDSSAATSIIRLYTMCFMLYVACTRIDSITLDYEKIVKTLFIVVLIISITGVIERFAIYSTYHVFMDHYELNRNGELVFKMPSYTIMGDIPRMCGFVNGPNQFGVTISMLLSLLIFIYLNFKHNLPSIKCLFVITLGVICLLLSFSRAGWFILICSILGYLHLQGKHVLNIVFNIVFLLTIILLIGYMILPESIEVILQSVTGKEASAATRQGMITDAYNTLITDPFGHGLGSGRIDGGTFTESAHLIVVYEIGIQGLIIFLLFYFINILKISRKKTNKFSCLLVPLLIFSVISGFVSVNFDEAPFMLYFWFLMGVSQNKTLMYNINKRIYQYAK